MRAPDDSREITILESKGIQIKNHYYRIVLTSRRIMFDSASDNVHRSIPLSFIRGVEPGTDLSGDPLITLSALSAGGEIKNVILRFSKSDFPDPQLMRSHWYSELRERIDQDHQVLPDISPVNVLPAFVFCTKCGKKLADGSVFCDRCGAKILHPVQPAPPDRHDDRILEQVMRPAGSVREAGLPRKDQSSVYTGAPGTGKKAPVAVSSPRKKWKKTSFFSGFSGKKSALVIGVCLVAVIIAAAIFLMLIPSGSPAFNPASSGVNDSLSDFSAAAVPVSPDGNTLTNAENPGSLENPEDNSVPLETPAMPAPTVAPDPDGNTLTNAGTPGSLENPEENSVPLETPPEIPEETPVPLETPAMPTPTAAPGDPRAVLAMYPSLFNNGDGAGLRDLLSENTKSQYSVDRLNTELAASRSNGNTIQDIQVYEPAIDGGTANVETDFFWVIGGIPVSRSPRIFFVYEGERWRLDNLILKPEDL